MQAEIADVRQRLESEIQALRSSLEAADSLADTMSPRSAAHGGEQALRTQHVEALNQKDAQLSALEEQLQENQQRTDAVRTCMPPSRQGVAWRSLLSSEQFIQVLRDCKMHSLFKSFDDLRVQSVKRRIENCMYMYMYSRS